MVRRQEYEKKHIALLRELATECMVLLKQDGTFPLDTPSKVALYGSGARRTLKGGTGSGDVNVRDFHSIEDGLIHAGFEVTTSNWLANYEILHAEARQEFIKEIKNRAKKKGTVPILEGMGEVMPEPEYQLPLEEEGELAIYVLSRVSGEGSDRKAISGDFELTQTEIRDILYLNENFKKFLLVLNVGGVVDLEPVKTVSNILLLSQVGMTIGDSFVDILLGKKYPSGKLTATWASWKDYSSIGDFGEEDDTRYQEGIFVGYRYFDTVAKEPLYPFGFGLQYTNFNIENPRVKQNKNQITVSVTVRNIGNFKGKEIVQLYVSVPSNKLAQPYQSLVAFSKTKELKKNESQIVELTFSLEELASFDEKTACEFLEAGLYCLRVGGNSRQTQLCGVLDLPEEICLQQLAHAGGTPDFQDWIPESLVTVDEDLSQVPHFQFNKTDFYPTEVLKYVPSNEAQEFVQSLSDSELAYLCIGGFKEKGSDSVIGNAAMSVAGAAGETTLRLQNKGIPSIVMADGPAGVRISPQYGIDELGMYSVGESVSQDFIELIDDQVRDFLGISENVAEERSGTIYNQYCTAIPIGTAIGQSWNTTLCEKLGDLIGDEMQRFGIQLWLAPALNIQRMPLCGRNFEYYSEDPFLSGQMAAGITKGVQGHDCCGVTIKHYAANNQETNRFHSNSVLSERALREIYLRGFKIVIDKVNPVALMTSYNLLNGEHTSQRKDLIKGILQNEWGYGGLIISDWITTGSRGVKNKYPGAVAAGCIRAGNSLVMPGGRTDYENIIQSLNNSEMLYPLTRQDLEVCGANVIETIWKLTRIED